MIVLGLETASPLCSVGIADEAGPRAGESVPLSTVHSEKLPPLIRSVLAKARISLREVGAIAVSSGPGSFTGLRIGMSAAKGLCFALRIPLIPIPTFFAVAVSAAQKHAGAGKILVALDAKKGDFYWGMFTVRDGAVSPAGEVLLRQAGELRAEVEPVKRLVVVTDSSVVRGELGSGVLAVEEAEDHFRGDLIATLGVEKAKRGQWSDPAVVEPLYLKNFVPKQPRSST
ncbi:MAG: tRNA (adenosine(37)-N6)-threonylcarbamoyltransferase complex dimerization subunit type 1 TsaB [Bacteroidia bacterium]|nr:MAG: tRNA (adenosine(37)-N6)-threonylcarbamoyltransferase complex dimerization subunit type 1 TsaB [Bacteroidia bacterium]